MILSIWRYSHLALALVSSLLLIVASVTGIVLAFEPIVQKSQDFKSPGFDTVSLSHTVPLLNEKFTGIQEIAVDDNDFVTVKYSTDEEGDVQVYADPVTGNVLGTPQLQAPIFTWMTTLHRSLFLKETGRLIVGIASFFLILIGLSGIFLIVQRQNGWKNFFSTIEKTGFVQYYHAWFGRIVLIFILAIAVTGTYLAVYRFVPPPANASAKINDDDLVEEPELSINEFPIFKNSSLSNLKKLQYPFSDFPEDYYNVQFKDRGVSVNQFNGNILAEEVYSTAYKLADVSLRWHTGRNGILWAIVLAIASAYILFFIYSGFAITLKRRRSVTKNKHKAEDSTVVILVGSENGGTFKFADAIYKQLLKHGEKVFITNLSNYSTFPKAEHLLIMTSTYGQGDPPSNAKKFLEKLHHHPQTQPIKYSIVAFGSRSYQQFCKFAYDIEHALETTSWAQPATKLFTVDDKSPQDFSDWLTAWKDATGFQLLLPRELLQPDQKDLQKLTVASKTLPDAEDTFLIRLNARNLKHAESGDLLAVYPKNDHRERLYSIGKIDKDIQLSVKLHEHGLGSGFLNDLQVQEKIQGKLIKNQHFRFPHHAEKVIMIANGTGIAPFLGMIHNNGKKLPIELFCGFRSRASYDLYSPFLETQVKQQRLSKIHLSLSREKERQYVSHRIEQNADIIADALRSKTVIMICGSLSMQNDVLKVLDEIASENNLPNTTDLIDKGKILTDCY